MELSVTLAVYRLDFQDFLVILERGKGIDYARRYGG